MQFATVPPNSFDLMLFTIYPRKKRDGGQQNLCDGRKEQVSELGQSAITESPRVVN